MRVLIVEDDESCRELLSAVVETFEHHVFSAKNVERATEMLAEVKPQVMLLDLLLEGTVSTPFIAVARQMLGGKAPRIIILSAMHGAKKVAEENHCDFLAKPFEMENLRKVIDGE